MKAGGPAAASAESRALDLLARVGESTAELRGAALLGADGGQLGSTDGSDWSEGAGRLWRATDACGEGATQLHVATADGEVFAVRERAATAVAVTERFALASLVLSDLRSVLRVLAGASG